MGPVYRFLLLLLPDISVSTLANLLKVSLSVSGILVSEKGFGIKYKKKQSGKKMTKTKAKTKRLLFVVDNDIDP